MMNTDILIERGYKKWKSNHVLFPYSDFIYQRLISDCWGKKYYIDLVHYPSSNTHGKATLPEAWDCVLNINFPHQRFCQYHIDLDKLNEIEEKCELFFKTMGCEYYELF